jgi:hypothetical protein
VIAARATTGFFVVVFLVVAVLRDVSLFCAVLDFVDVALRADVVFDFAVRLVTVEGRFVAERALETVRSSDCFLVRIGLFWSRTAASATLTHNNSATKDSILPFIIFMYILSEC